MDALRNGFLIALSAALAVSLLPMPGAAVSYGNMGSKVLGPSTDFNPLYGTTGVGAATICARDTGALTTFSDDLFYLNMDGAGTVVATFDLRLTTADGRIAGTMVLPGDTDVGQTFTSVAPGLVAGCAPFAANLRSLEADGLPGWTAGDLLAWSTDATLNAGDVRLSVAISNTGQDTQSVTVGTVVVGTDVDVANVANANGLFPDCTTGPPLGTCTSTAVLADAGSFALRSFDANLNGVVDSGDSLLAAYLPAATPNPASYSLNDVYLFGSTFGGKVTRTGADYVSEPKIACAGAVSVGCFTTAPVLGYVRSIGASDTNCDRLLIHFRDQDGVAGGVVQVDDVLLYSPAAGLAACTNPPPASAVVAGSRVNSAATHFQGTALQATAALAAQVFYVDVNGNNRYDTGDAVYVKKPATFGGTTTGCAVASACHPAAGDLRVTAVTAGASSFTAGSVVGGTDADISAFAGSGTNTQAGMAWVVRMDNHDGSNEIPLQTLASVIYHDANADSIWQPATESVYLDLGTTANGCGATGTTMCVNSGDFLLSKGSDSGVAAPSTTTAIACPGPADCAFVTTTFKSASADFKVTGSDTTAEAARGETIYFSKDALVNSEDFALSAATGSAIAAGQVTCAANACLNEGVHASDTLWFSWCPAAGCPARLLPGDIQVSPTLGTRFTSTGSDFVPSLKDLAVAGGTLLRYNKGDSGAISDDTFYASTDGGTVTTQDDRLTSFDASHPAGSVLTSSDTQELASASDVSAGTAGGLAALLAARDVDGVTGYTLGDPVYVNNPGGTLGGTTDAILSAYDLRATEATAAGQVFAAGTIVVPGNADQTAGTAFTGLGGWLLGYHDDNLNGVFDTGDVLYGLPPASPALATLPQPPLGAVRLTGPVAAVSSGGGGGGTVVTPPVTTTATTTTTTTTTTSTTTSTTTTSSSTTTPPPGLDAINQALKDSLRVTRQGETNVVAWAAQPGVQGYQVWGHDSPWALVVTVDAATTSVVQQAPASMHYLVTAFTSEATKLQDINTQPVPGLGVNPAGPAADGSTQAGGTGEATSPTSGKGAIPAPGLLLGLGAVAVALALTRRRLA